MRKKIGIIALGVAAVLAGCGTEVPDLSRLDNSMAAQYVADALLRADKHYDESLDYDHSILEPTPVPEPTQAPTPKPGSSSKPGGEAGTPGDGQGQTVSNVSLSEIYGIPGVSIEQKSYAVKSTYGSQKYAMITARPNKKLAVVYFTVANNTGKEKRVKLDSQDVKAQLYLNGENAGGPMLSIADGDLQTFNKKIGAGKKSQGVLLFEIDKSAKISKLEVRFTKGNNQASAAVR